MMIKDPLKQMSKIDYNFLVVKRSSIFLLEFQEFNERWFGPFLLVGIGFEISLFLKIKGFFINV